MTLRLPLTLPAYTPSSWELILPGYPVILSNFRSASYPDILGSLPSDSRWKLTFQNMTSDEALALLLPWRASGCGLWALTQLPEQLAGGVDNADFKKRLTGTTWAIEKEPTKQSVKKGRFTITIDLIHELTFESVYGPRNSPLDLGAIPLLLNLSNIMSIVAMPVALDPYLPVFRNLGPLAILDFATIDGLAAVAFPVYLDKTRRRDGIVVFTLDLPTTDVTVVALPVDRVPPPPVTWSAGPVLGLGLESGVTVIAEGPLGRP
jgi:hypothetical protein